MYNLFSNRTESPGGEATPQVPDQKVGTQEESQDQDVTMTDPVEYPELQGPSAQADKDAHPPKEQKVSAPNTLTKTSVWQDKPLPPIQQNHPGAPPQQSSKGQKPPENSPATTSEKSTIRASLKSQKSYFERNNEKASLTSLQNLAHQRLTEINRLKEQIQHLQGDINTLQRDIDGERARREKAEKDANQARSHMEEARKLWKRTARELDRIKSQNQGFPQIPDNYFIELTTQLKYNIRSFAIQYFSGEHHVQGRIHNTAVWESCMEHTTPRSRAYEEYLLSPSQRPSIIQAFLWKYLERRVFDRFRWGGQAGQSLRGMRTHISPLLHRGSMSSPMDPEAEKKFQIWTTEATGYILAGLDTSEGTDDYECNLNMRLHDTNNFWDIARPFLVRQDGDHDQDFQSILDSAIYLDQNIHRQVARLEWAFPIPGEQFNPTTMVVEQGQKVAEIDRQIILVVSPGLRKRGKSNGQEFHIEQWLLPMEISCLLPEDIPDGKPPHDVICSLLDYDRKGEIE